MPRCSCAGSTCGCKVIGGAGITVTGLGTEAAPYQIVATLGDIALALEFDDTADVVWSVVGDGVPGDPLVVSATTPRKNLPTYATGGLPDPVVWGAGAVAYDTTSKTPVYSDGTRWRLGSPVPFEFSKGGVLATATGTHRIYNDTGRTLTILAVRASVGTAPTGAAIRVDVNKNGTSIYATTQANRPNIAVSTNTDLGETPDTLTIANGEYFTIDIDAVGSTVAGSDLTVVIWAS